MGTMAIPGTARDYDNYLEYLNTHGEATGIWDVYRQLVGDQRNAEYTYGVRMNFPAIDTAPNQLFTDHGTLRAWVEDPARFGENSHLMDQLLFVPESTDGLTLEIVRSNRPADFGPPRFRAGSSRAIWGYLGAKVSNCVIRQMSDRVAYYYSNGDRRKYMWTDGGDKRSTTRGDPTHSAPAMKKLYMDSTYRSVKEGCGAYMQDRGLKGLDDFCFEPRDLCDLADKCKCRILVFVTGGDYRVCRWDTDDLVPVPPTIERGSRYVFCFNMTSDQHVEILPPETMQGDHGPTKESPSRKPRIIYLSDRGFEDILYRGGDKPAEDRKLYVVRNRTPKNRYMPPVDGCDSYYASWVLQCGEEFYKHECLEGWTTDLIDNGVPVSFAASFTCKYDPYYYEMRELYGVLNVRPVTQRRVPGLFLAATESDMQFGHMQLPMDDGSDMYEYDGRRWYFTDWSKVDGFGYFHGIPMSDTWNEYKAPPPRASYNGRGEFVRTPRMIGNAAGDEPFSFGRDKYAIFQVESLDISGCSDNTRAHFARDGLFVDFDPSSHVMYLPSPVVQFLQDRGATWRASRLWVCYGCEDHWIPGTSDGETLRAKLEETKTYPMILGKLMSGRRSAYELTYVAPDKDTAESLRYWYSSQFAHGRPIGDRDDPYVVYEGEEREYGSESDLRPDQDPESMIFTTEGEFYGANQRAHSHILNGCLCPAREGASTFFVSTFQQDYEWRRTYCHISGAQHAYCFVRIYEAILRLPCDEIVGFSLDAFRTRSDVTGLLGGFVSAESAPGTFKPAEVKPYRAAFTRRAAMLSNLYTPRFHLRGINAACRSAPTWNAYKDGLSKISIVTGPAGSGKTTRHFRLYEGSEDYRLPESALYITMTNHLAHHVRSSLGVRALTNFKGFNRKVNEERPPETHDRYAKKRETDTGFNQLFGSHSVLLDEVSMISTEKIRDAIEMCRSHWCQLLITGDFDRERFYQLSPVNHEGETLQDVLREISDRVSWVPPMRVFRQISDSSFAGFLGELRLLNEKESWDHLFNSDMFEHISLSDMVAGFNTEKDLVAHPWHRVISRVTSEVYESMGEVDLIRLRGNFDAPRKVRENDHEVITKMKVSDSDRYVYKGSTCFATKETVREMQGGELMREGLYSPTQAVNPLVGATIFNLQGLSMTPDGTLYVLKSTPDATEWSDPRQPKLAYVAASRARSADRLVIVDMQINKRPRT